MEEVLKSLQIGPKIFAQRSNTRWDILLAGCILTMETVCLQTEYMSTWRMRVTLYGVPMDLTEY